MLLMLWLCEYKGEKDRDSCGEKRIVESVHSLCLVPLEPLYIVCVRKSAVKRSDFFVICTS